MMNAYVRLVLIWNLFTLFVKAAPAANDVFLNKRAACNADNLLRTLRSRGVPAEQFCTSFLSYNVQSPATTTTYIATHTPTT